MSDACSVKINKCSDPGCNPVEQVRGDMKPQDYHTQYARWEAVSLLAREHGLLMLDPDEYKRDAFDVEEGGDGASDIRIACSKCRRHTPWGRADLEGWHNHGPADNRRYCVKRDGNKDNVRAGWNEMVS
jgi:hypothetical protein